MSNTTKPALSESYKNTIRNYIRTYIRAKDDNKPHLMSRVFTDSATLSMKVKTDSISFPADSVGIDAITDVLVKNFSQSYENVYTFCITDSFESKINTSSIDVSCDWLVCMTERNTGNVRVGAGRYDWRFGKDSKNEKSALANHLLITIEQMAAITPEYSIQLFEWIGKLPYPFCDSESLIEEMPDFELDPELEPLKLIKTYISNKT